MSDQKPLPLIPTPTTLSIVARNHRARLIRHLLSETQESNVEDWKCAIEDALDAFGTSIGAGNWLKGIKRGKHTSTGMRNSYRDFEQGSKKSDPNNGEKYTGLSEQRQVEEPADSYAQSLEELKALGVRSSLPTGSSSHLLLCLTPLNDSGGENKPETGHTGCVFHSGTFTWSTLDSDNPGNVVLYGLREWRKSENMQLVGGTFTLNGVKSRLQHHQLYRILKIAVYIHLSLILEQYFLVDSGVSLKYPPPKSILPPTPAPNRPRLTHHESVDAKPTRRTSLLSSGILSFFSRKTFGHRSQTMSPIIERGASLDLTVRSPDTPPDTSEEGGGRHRRFSFIGDKLERRISLRSSLQPQPIDNAEPPFAAILRRLEASRELLSTSPGVSFALPSLLIELAGKEKESLNRKLTGDERVALASLIGWDGKDSRGNGMSGMLGFVRQQGLSVLRSKLIPAQLLAPEKLLSTTLSPSSSLLNLPKSGLKMCGRPQLLTYRYYSHEESEDQSLGEMILDLCATAQLECEQLGCKFKRGEHEIRLIHGGLRIVVVVEPSQDPNPDTDNTTIELWESCIVCDCKSSRRTLTDGAFMLSYAKFLEILIYSPLICSLGAPICGHTTPPDSSQELPPSRLNIKRHFRTSKASVSFALSIVDDIFELQVPRLQIIRGSDKSARTSALSTPTIGRPKLNEVDGSEDKKVLREEIKLWWGGVADHIDKLEHALSVDDLHAFHKALPRLPSDDDAYEDIGLQQTPTQSSISTLPRLPPNTPTTPTANGSEIFASPSGSAPIASSMRIPTPLEDNSAVLLANLRHTLHQAEHSLYVQLAQTPVSSLNDVRRVFLSAAKGAHKRLDAWQEKHLYPKAQHVGNLSAEEPEWFGHACHVVPGSNVIIREDDWGSIIAFALSTADYNRELATLSTVRSSSNTSPPLSPPLSGSSFFSTAAGHRFFSSAANRQLDPDKDGAVWHVPEPYSAVIGRKEHIKDPTSLLSIREVLRQKLQTDGASGTVISRSASLLNPAYPAAAPVSAWATPNVSLNLQAAGGEVSGLPSTVSESVEKLLQGFDNAASDISHPESVTSEASSSAIFDAHIRRGKASSIISIESDQTIGKDNSSKINLSLPPVPPPKDERASPKPPPEESTSVSEGHAPPSPSFASTLASGLGTAMRYVINGYESPRAHSPAFKSQHGLLLADAASIDARPHIKYDWTIGKRLKFSCTIYYAKQFDTLRRRCGTDDVFLKSLSRSMNWAAEGGKSKSNFWKTSDDRFIIKTLVNAWNVDDLQVLIDLAPSYFRYMESTTSKATVLAKLIGFYTIEIRNLESGTVQSKADLLIMENLFYDRTINKTFDLKGIQGRKVKARANSPKTRQISKTLFDGEWIEGQQQTLMLLRPHSKTVLHEAIKSDADFLSRSNIMDYSLLLGVDDERKQIACGLVDTIGSFTFAKTLEYKAKHGLQSGKEITVMPPAEYHDRFVKALEGYFLACPDKWSKPADPSKIISDPNLLPSVL